MSVSSLENLQQNLLDYIPKNNTQKYSADWGLGRTKKLLELAGNPQEKLKVIHIAGTSGKGSTAFLTSRILTSQGFKVGLNVSPFLVDFREAFEVDGSFLQAQKVIDYFVEFKGFVDALETTLDELGQVWGRPTYFEILSSFAYFVFAQEKVDYAVVEVGLGGLFDCSNTVSRCDKICVINKIGFDHVEILGGTIEEIAFQKAGIIQPTNQVITIDQDYPEALQVIKNEAKLKQSNLSIIESQNILNYSQNGLLQNFDFKFEDFFVKDIQLGLMGNFQVLNCSLALAVLYKLSIRDIFEIDQAKLKKTLLDSRFKGRMELLEFKYKNSTHNLLFDGAHNEQKMQALISNLKQIYPEKKFDFLVAFSSTKDLLKMLEQITALANSITVSQFSLVKTQAISKQSYSTVEVEQGLKELNFNNYSLEENIQAALQSALENQKSDQILVITGSLYFLSFIYKELEKIKSL